MRRIVILGNAGSGKSTLARRLGERLDLPVVHLDALFWQPGWKPAEEAAFRARASAAISGDRWVCEGNYARLTFDLRLPRADLAIWLDASRIVCMARVALRAALGRPRPDMAAGCEERLDGNFLSFLRFVWNFDRQTRPRIEAARQAQGPLTPVLHLRGRRQVSTFLASLAGGPETPREL